MKMRLASMCIIGISALALSGCGQKIADADGSIVLKAGFSTVETDPRVVATRQFQEEVEQATEGRIRIEIYPNGELGSDADLISGIISGSLDITASSAGNFANYAPNAGISALPFLFSDFEDAWAFVDSDTETAAEAELANYNVHVLSHYDNGFRCVTTSAKAGPIESVEDMEDLVIRTPENRTVMDTMLALGAQPRILDFTKLYDALKNGSFDAQENPVPVIYNNCLYEVQENLAITNHSYDVMPFVIREDVWKQLTPEDQDILSQAALHAQETDRTLVRDQTDEYVQKLQEVGMNITYPDLESFKEKTASVYDTLSNTYDPDLMREVLNR